MNVPEVTCKRVLTTDRNGDFSRRVVDALFRLATMEWTRIFAVLHGTTYLQPTVKVPSSCYQSFGNSVQFSGGVVPRAIRKFLAARAKHTFRMYYWKSLIIRNVIFYYQQFDA